MAGYSMILKGTEMCNEGTRRTTLIYLFGAFCPYLSANVFKVGTGKVWKDLKKKKKNYKQIKSSHSQIEIKHTPIKMWGCM
jgi:hypothetical protein